MAATLSISATRNGMLGEVAAYIRTIPTRVVPYAASTALTRTAKDGQVAIVAEMPRVFDRPTRYTLNATRLIPATAKSLIATVAVKDQAGGTSTRPESYLLPEVEGGNRSEKRMERALRYSGVLARGQYVVPGLSARLDAAGNVSAAAVRQVLSALKEIKAASNARDSNGKRLRAGRSLRNDLFIGTPSVGTGAGRRPRSGAQAGIYRREGGRTTRRLRLLFVITNKRPSYGKRLDFEGTVAQVARDRFAVEFERAASALLARRP